MSINKNQSAISEVRDQLSLDFADGEYLNVVSRNLGMDRPIIGFSDDIWRALVKQLALEYKQINTQFHKMMEIVFGVRITQAGSLAEDVAIGDNKCVLNETAQFPQVGTLVLDEGLITEETHKYCYIDRSTGTVYLDGTTFARAHTAREFDTESPILTYRDSQIVVSDSSRFPGTDDGSGVFSYPVVLGRGTVSEETIEVVACNRSTGVLTLASSPSNIHSGVVATGVRDDLAQEVYLPTSFIEVDDSSSFPSQGIIRLRPSTTFTVVGDVVPNTNNVITVAADTFIPDSLVGFELVMATDADTTPATSVVGRTRRVIANTANTITLEEDWASLGNAPANGDTFFLFPIVEYVSNDHGTGILNLREILDLDTASISWTIPNNSVVEVMEAVATVSFAPVKSPGQGWDIIQSTPGVVEIFVPEDIDTINDLRSASYLHTASDLSNPTTTLSANVSAGATSLPVALETDFTITGVLELGASERVAYARPVSTIASAVAPLATSLVLDDTSAFGVSGTLILNPGALNQETVTFTANNTATNTLTVAPLSSSQKEGVVAVCHTVFLLSRPLTNPFSSGTTVSYFDPPHIGTDVVIGDKNQQADTWEGPYVYEETAPAPTGATVAPTTLGQIAPGPTTVSIDQGSLFTTIEVENALPMFGISNLDVVVGVNKASAETVRVQEVSLRNRVLTTVSSNTSVGATELPVVSFGPGGGVGADFPSGSGFRIVLGAGVGTEVCKVLGRNGSNFVLESPTTSSHNSGVEVRLVSDVLRLASPLSNGHSGAVPLVERSTATESLAGRAIFPLSDESNAEVISPLLDSITLASALGLDISGGRVILNFGYASVETKSTFVSNTATTLTVADGSVFPSAFPFIVEVSKGKRVSEKVLITGRTGNVLDIDYALGFSHSVGDEVVFVSGSPEDITYNEISSNDLSFDTPIMLNYTHYPVEPVVNSSVDSDPRDTGFDYPFRMPDALLTRLQYLLDIIRAAGIQVVLINKR